jgi:Type IV secretion system pilin
MNTVKHYIYAGIGTLITTRAALAEIDYGGDKVKETLKGPGADTNPIDTIQSFVSGLLTFLGLIMVAMALWGGWKILTSGSEDEGKEAGKKIIINAVIGIVVIFFAWTITNLVFSILAGNGRIE